MDSKIDEIKKKKFGFESESIFFKKFELKKNFNRYFYKNLNLKKKSNRYFLKNSNRKKKLESICLKKFEFESKLLLDPDLIHRPA